MSDYDVSEAVGELENMVNAAWDAGYVKGVDWAKKCGGGIDAMTDAELAEHGLVRMPTDADGEYIHFGDVLDQFGTPMTVYAMSDPDPDQGDCMLELITDGISDSTWVRARKMRHHHAPTVEDVLREFADEMNQNLGMYTGEAIDADEWRDADAKTVEKFATKLRLAGENA